MNEITSMCHYVSIIENKRCIQALTFHIKKCYNTDP